MQIIVAADQNWAIGKDGDLLFHNSEDMKFFRTKTTGNVVVMGRKTLDSFPGGRPLKNRTNVVLSGNPGFKREGCIVLGNVQEAVEYLKQYEEDQIFIVGGGLIYREFLKYSDTAFVTKIDHAYEADTYFPNLDEDPEWELSELGEWKEADGIRFAFVTYKRK